MKVQSKPLRAIEQAFGALNFYAIVYLMPEDVEYIIKLSKYPRHEDL